MKYAFAAPLHILLIHKTSFTLPCICYILLKALAHCTDLKSSAFLPIRAVSQAAGPLPPHPLQLSREASPAKVSSRAQSITAIGLKPGAGISERWAALQHAQDAAQRHVAERLEGPGLSGVIKARASLPANFGANGQGAGRGGAVPGAAHLGAAAAHMGPDDDDSDEDDMGLLSASNAGPPRVAGAPRPRGRGMGGGGLGASIPVWLRQGFGSTPGTVPPSSGDVGNVDALQAHGGAPGQGLSGARGLRSLFGTPADGGGAALGIQSRTQSVTVGGARGGRAAWGEENPFGGPHGIASLGVPHRMPPPTGTSTAGHNDDGAGDGAGGTAGDGGGGGGAGASAATGAQATGSPPRRRGGGGGGGGGSSQPPAPLPDLSLVQARYMDVHTKPAAE